MIQGLKRHLTEISRHIGRKVSGRIMHFVQQLLGAGSGIDAPAGTGHLADHRMAHGIDFGQREAEAVEFGHFLHPGVGEVAAADLPCAFEQVPDQGAAPQ